MSSGKYVFSAKGALYSSLGQPPQDGDSMRTSAESAIQRTVAPSISRRLVLQ
jgi:hypothetical protein